MQGNPRGPWQKITTTRQIHLSTLGSLESPSYLALQKELLVSALQDIQLGVVESGILITKPISLSHVAAPGKGATAK